MQTQTKTSKRNFKAMRRRGSTMVEAALIMPILLVLSLFIIQYGIFMNAAVSLTNLSREGVRLAAVQPGTDAAIKYRMQQLCPATLRWSDIQNNIVISPSESSADRKVGSQSLITVQINYNMGNKLFLPSTLSFPFMGKIKLFSSTYTAKSVMMVE